MLINLADPNFDLKVKRWDTITKTITALVLIVTAIYGVKAYLAQRAQLIEQNKQAQEQRLRDFNSIIYRTRLELYLEVTDALSRFAYASTLDEAERADQRFWELYDGKLSIVEDQEVKDKMVFCGDFLEKWETCKKIPPPNLFQDLAYDLTQACRRSLMTAFPGELNPLTQGQSPHRQYIESKMLNDVCKK